MSELTLDVDPGRLPPRSRTIYESIWVRMLAGDKPGEISRELGVQPSWVSDRLAEFYTDVLLSHGVFKPVHGIELDALRDHIAEHGIIQPILVDERDQTIKGRTRRKIAAELGVDCPKIVLAGLTADRKRELSVALTVGRRHLSRGEKRAAITAELMANANRSDRKIAAICGVHNETVAAVRSELAADEEKYLNPHAVVESDGIRQQLPAAEKILGRAECPCCGETLTVIRREGGLALEHAAALAAA